MLKKVLWIAAACATILVALAVSRGLDFDRPADQPVSPPVEASQEAALPPAPVEAAPEAPMATAPPPAVLTPDEQQIQDDAAATGMTTMEPESPPVDSPPT